MTDCSASDGTVRATIFGRDGLSDPLGICRRARLLPADPRFDLLRRYVFPDGTESVRIDFEFAPTGDNGQLSTSRETEHNGHVISPARLLVDSARATNRLNELRHELASRSSNDPHPIQRTAFAVLLAIAQKDFEAANSGISRLHQLTATAVEIPAERAAEAVVIEAAMTYSETLEAARDLAFLVYEQARNKSGPRSERWHRYSYSMKHLLQWLADAEKGDSTQIRPVLSRAFAPVTSDVEKPVDQWPLKNWHPVSRMTAETSGDGYPTAAWSARSGEVSHVTSHDHDYLYYRIPLAGNFSVEADTTTFGYRDIQLAIGGVFAGPGYDLKACLHGNFRRDSPSLRIDPPLSPVNNWMRVRLVVRDGIRTTFVNGREVFQAAHSGDPWLAIHSPWYTNGAVRNLRITGDVAVPEVINLLTNPDLTGWLTYENEIAGSDDGDWQLRGDVSLRRAVDETAAGTVELIGQRSSAPAGSSQESLLRYHRPVIEDGTITYEFFYQEGASQVSPSVGQVAFLLNRDGVNEHRITNGRYERTGLDPAGTIAMRRPLSEQPPPKSLPLIATVLPLQDGEWNRVELAFSGDLLELSLNGQLVHHTQLTGSELRQFGLFHYSDQTEARVRRIRWRGGWSRQLPPVDQQELAGDATDAINARLAELPAVFEHNFATQGLPQELFSVVSRVPEGEIELLPTGVLVTQPGGAGYPSVAISPLLSASGDFDIIAEFANFRPQIGNSSEAKLQVYAALNDRDTNECRIYRKLWTSDSGSQVHTAQSALFTGPSAQRRYRFPGQAAEEATSGRLRLARRGDVVHYLIAEDDSPHYRLISSEKVSDAPTRDGGLRLIIETLKTGTSNVLWKRVLIRAEALSGMAVLPRETIDQLNAQRAQLKSQRRFDFKQELTLDPFLIWGKSGSLEQTADGLVVTAPGSNDWRASGLAARFPIVGDFDVTLDADALQFERGPTGQYSALMLQAEFKNELQTAVEIKFVKHPSDNFTLTTQIRRRQPDGEPHHQELSSRRVTGAQQLRIARRGAIAALIFQETPASAEEIVARVEVGTHPIPPTFLRLLVHTGGVGRNTIVRFRSLTVAAEQLETAETRPESH